MLRPASATPQKQGSTEQEEADRPVGPGQPQIGQERRGREPVYPVLGARVGDACRFVFGYGTWHVSFRFASLASPDTSMPSKLQRLFVKSPMRPGPTSPCRPSRRIISETCLRLNSGDHVLVFNGVDGEWCARLVSVGKKKAQIVARASDAAPRARSRSALSLRSHQARPSRLYGTEGDRDGRKPAPAGDHPPHGGRAGQHRPAQGQRHRGGRAMRDLARARGRRAPRNCRSCSSNGTRAGC